MNILSFWGKTFKITFCLLIIAEVLSLIGCTFPVVNTLVFFLLTLTALAISLWKIEYGLWIILAELVIGSKGYLFSLEIGEFSVSIRLALFSVVFISWFVYALRNKKFIFRKTEYFWPFVVFLGFLGLALIIGYLNKNELKNIFFDWNGYLYFGLIFIFFEVINNWSKISRLMQVIFASVAVMALKTLFLVFYFAHQADEYLVRSVYRWVRVTGVGEITQFSEDFYRIFFQSHIYALIAFMITFLLIILLARKTWLKKNYRITWLLLIFSSTTLIISFSRSFWLALVVTLLIIFIYLIVKEKFSWKRISKIIIVMMVIIILELGLINFLVNIKLPGSEGSGTSTASLIKERITTTEEAALGSRFELLKPLVSRSLKSPIWGSGFGSTVTYQTLDPRTKEKNGGWYTTYSFEWGYLDIMLKMGILGLSAYLYFLWIIFKKGVVILKNTSSNQKEIYVFTLGVLFSLLSLVIIHFTTPYLNHPLGICFIMIAASLFYFLKKNHDQQSTPL